MLAPTLAFGVIGGEGVDPNSPVSPWAGVGSVLNGSGTFSGALISPSHVLTAAHIVAGLAPSAVTFQLNAGPPMQITASEIIVHPAYAGFTPGPDGTVHNDLAIIRLNGVAAALPYSLYTEPLSAGQALKFVGYGAGGDGVSGATTAADPSVKRTGQNAADQFLNGALGREVYVFDFDGPTATTNRTGGLTLGAGVEATLADGDSGSAGLVLDAGAWKLATVNTFVATFPAGPTDPGRFGTGGGGMVVAAYAPWINSVVTAVPEPSTHGMMLLGAGLVGMAAYRRRRAAL